MTPVQQNAPQTQRPQPASDPAPLDLGRFHAYDVALQFQALVTRTLSSSALTPVLRDQLDRAPVSVLASTAEGFGRRPRRDKARFFNYARGSVYECVALVDALYVRGLMTPADYLRGKQLLVRLVQMLTRAQTRLLAA